ncbi:MAG: RNA polymerase subunit sigma-24 [Acidobacteria bacterium]|nr:MAG: RNA polymerase subunit sigma-24 [Acidobacteriota bacterium]PYQ19475.1 MAG: RNA polymerase subunit sigma-24 [Acidobacteriota bacterium]
MERMDGRDDDTEAVAQARTGDADAFRRLVERHSAHVFRLAYRMTRNDHDAEDVVQEAFLKAYRSLDRFEERAHFGSWLHRIAANCAYDALRARERRHESREPAAEGESDGPMTEPASDDPTPDRLVFGAEVRRRVAVAMRRMSTLERSAFTLRHFEGMSIEEIGRALEVDGSAAKQSVFRAVRKVRAALGRDTGLRPPT